ncbi:MAG: Rrf2 family transcriptional regulator [Rubricoccaceae bacterium]|nr:Rrf2 family transcriptional regulator [Rubricoccaceae bacterium]
MLLSKTCEYGLRMAIYLASNDLSSFVPIRNLSDTLGIPYHFLAKIAQTMIRSQILQSTRGPRGGVRLSRPPSQVSLHEIVNVLDGPGIFESCVLGLPECGIQQPCPLHNQWMSTREEIHALFAETSLEDLALRIEADQLRISIPARSL